MLIRQSMHLGCHVTLVIDAPSSQHFTAQTELKKKSIFLETTRRYLKPLRLANEASKANRTL